MVAGFAQGVNRASPCDPASDGAWSQYRRTAYGPHPLRRAHGQPARRPRAHHRRLPPPGQALPPRQGRLAQAAARMAELNEAYAVLSDAGQAGPLRRAIGLARGAAAAATPGRRPSHAARWRRRHGRRQGPTARPDHRRPTRRPGSPADLRSLPRLDAQPGGRYDRDYIEWLSRTTMGRNYKRELDELLHRAPRSHRPGPAGRRERELGGAAPASWMALVTRRLGDGPLQHHRRHQRGQDDGRQQDRIDLAVDERPARGPAPRRRCRPRRAGSCPRRPRWSSTCPACQRADDAADQLGQRRP